jgi:ribosomal protein L44E
MKKSTVKFTVVYECTVCGKQTKTIEQHDKHMKEEHGK